MKTYLYKSILISLILAITPFAQAQIGISIGIDLAPPALPVYAQPVIPGDGYMWTPGYWSWNANDNDYYWVPGTWVNAPYVGALWTPGYWGFVGGRYSWNHGYWGDHIGYYGGINYGFGYAGVGYQGGYWNHGAFSYNRSVNNVSNVHITNVYNSKVTVVQNSHVSFNGGTGGVQMTASKNEQIINSMPHNQATPQQSQHETTARTQPDQRLSVNHGSPKVAATPEAGSFNSTKVEPGRQDQVAHAANVAPRPAAPKAAPHEQSRPASAPAPRPEEHAAPAPRPEAHAAPAPRPENHAAPQHEEENKEK
jgi:hypothetical protein